MSKIGPVRRDAKRRWERTGWKEESVLVSRTRRRRLVLNEKSRGNFVECRRFLLLFEVQSATEAGDRVILSLLPSLSISSSGLESPSPAPELIRRERSDCARAEEAAPSLSSVAAAPLIDAVAPSPPPFAPSPPPSYDPLPLDRDPFVVVAPAGLTRSAVVSIPRLPTEQSPSEPLEE